MSIKLGSIPVGSSQKVAGNLKEQESKKAFVVNWNQTSANIGQVVGISGIINIALENISQITVKILFDDKPFAAAENIEIKNGKITAQWKVTPFKTGTFTAGVYDVEVRYDGVSGKTQTPLRIVSSLVNRDVSSFG
jgi:hypothetical protein